MFSQGDIDKRGVKIMPRRQARGYLGLRANDRLTATIITSKPPRVMTEKEVNATLAKSGAGAALGRCGLRQARRRAQVRARRPRRAGAGSRAPSQARADVGRCAEEAAEDRQPCRSLASRVSRRWWPGSASPSGGVARRVSSPVDAGPRHSREGARSGRCFAERRDGLSLPFCSRGECLARPAREGQGRPT